VRLVSIERIARSRCGRSYFPFDMDHNVRVGPSRKVLAARVLGIHFFSVVAFRIGFVFRVEVTAE